MPYKGGTNHKRKPFQGKSKAPQVGKKRQRYESDDEGVDSDVSMPEVSDDELHSLSENSDAEMVRAGEGSDSEGGQFVDAESDSGDDESAETASNTQGNTGKAVNEKPKNKYSQKVDAKYLDRGSDQPAKWYELPSAQPPVEAEEGKAKKAPRPSGPVTIEELKAKSENALEEMIEAANRKSPTSHADQKWLEQMLSSGTISDKVAALALQIRTKPLSCLRNLDLLLTMAKKKGHRESAMSIDALKDTFIAELLPPNRKLVYFTAQPWAVTYAYRSSHPNDSRVPNTHPYAHEPTNERLALWLLEDGIKQRYASFLQVLEEGLHDPLMFVKSKRITIVNDLLYERPEAEGTLLALLVGKMSDPDRKVASKVHYSLFKLLKDNPGMSVAVVKEVERVIFKPFVKERAQYYAVAFLNQVS